MLIKSKLPNINVSIFSKMTALANTHGALNLAQGFPNFPSSEKLTDLVTFYMKKGMNQYAPMPGVLTLREHIAAKYNALYSTPINPETDITITSGATQAIYTSIATFIHQGDEVILFEPAYDCYAPAIKLHGGIPIAIHLDQNHFTIDWELVQKSINSKTKMIMINSPHNPSGSVLKKDDLIQLEKIVQGSDILILSDEVYEHLIFDRRIHESILNYPKLFNRSIVIYSFGKTYHNTGWKMGYVIAPPALTKEFRNVHQFLVFSSNTPIQYALADFMNDTSEYLQVLPFYEKKRDRFLDLIKNSRFTFTPASGTYFQLLDYSNISNKNDMEFADWLTIEHKIAGIPLSPFYDNPPQNHLLRICFAKTDETLKQAAEILCKI